MIAAPDIYDSPARPESGRQAFTFTGIGTEPPEQLDREDIEQYIRDIVREMMSGLASVSSISDLVSYDELQAILQFFQSQLENLHKITTTIVQVQGDIVTAGAGISISQVSRTKEISTDPGDGLANEAGSTGKIVVDLADSEPGLEFSSGDLKALVNTNAGMELSSGIAVDLAASEPGLEFSSGDLKALVNTSAGMELNSGIAIDLAETDAGLQFDGSGDLQVEVRVAWWKVTSVADPLVCTQVVWNGSSWAEQSGTSGTNVELYPQLDTTHYHGDDIICAVKHGSYWVSLYNQPCAFCEYEE